MIKKTTVHHLFMVLPVAAAVFALSGCGGDDDNPVIGGGNNNGSPSITACFTVNKTVSYAMTASNVPSGSTAPNKSTVGPMTYNGQAVTGQTFSSTSGTTTSTAITYWAVTNSGVTGLASVNYDGTIASDDTFFPQNMEPGQVVTNSGGASTTFMGFETFTLAGKTFSNTCHFKAMDQQGDPIDKWYASGYGMIKQAVNSSALQYNGSL